MPTAAVRLRGGSEEVGAGRLLARSALLLGLTLVTALVLAQVTFRLLRDPDLGASVWWPLGGVAVALLARLPTRDWPAALTGSAVALFLTGVDTHYGVAAALGLALANGGELLLTALLARRAFPRGVLLDSPTAGIRFALCTVSGAMVGALVFTLTQVLDGAGPAWPLFHGYLRAHLLGLPMVSPLFLVAPAEGRRRLDLEWAAQLALTGAVAGGVFGTGQTVVPSFVCAVPLIWGGLRLGPLRAMGSLLLMALIATVGTLQGSGPVVQEPPWAQTLAVQVVLFAATLCTLCVVLTAAEKSALLRAARDDRADLAEAEQIAGTGTAVWDLRTGETRWSEGLYAQLGRSPDSVSPAPEAYLENIHPDDRGVVAATLARVPDAERLPNMEFRLLRPDGTERIMTVRNRIDRDPDGTAVQVRSTVLDVTATREAEAALRRTHRALDAVANVAIVGIDPATHLITFWGRGAQELLGWTAEETIGRRTPLIYHLPAELDRAMAETGLTDPVRAAAEVMAAGARRWTWVRRDGSHFAGHGSLTTVTGPDGEPETLIGVIVDLGPV
ncbi:hypothetical protein Kisp01_53170 [Kineosporia sp. NBRC 101677]|uniref:PAS domain-containing protein n=1 Tax=Kineosporia sp. NBRC 101677 TaxID=3032197 RepID=UPI0024A4D9C8|nr:PAS domain-containing protein [Kineosporia sp. NBRC 101677]GLY18303.1 hypothetical protein Kisp01_53170 [Kineosporia sp. NBRC 101677]